MAHQFALLRERRFAPFFSAQFLGAFNDNLFKTALVTVITFDAAILPHTLLTVYLIVSVPRLMPVTMPVVAPTAALAFVAVVGIVIASLIGLFWHNDALQFLISAAGVIVFTGLTAWDALVATAFPRVGAVDQPLWDLVQDRDEILRIASEGLPVPSCRVHALGAAALSR